MLEIRSILEGDKGFNSPALQEFAHYVAQKLPDKFESTELTVQAAEIANSIMFASFDAKNDIASLAKDYPNLYDYVQSHNREKASLQFLCRNIVEVLINQSYFLFSAALAAIKPLYFG